MLKCVLLRNLLTDCEVTKSVPMFLRQLKFQFPRHCSLLRRYLRITVSSTTVPGYGAHVLPLVRYIRITEEFIIQRMIG